MCIPSPKTKYYEAIFNEDNQMHEYIRKCIEPSDGCLTDYEIVLYNLISNKMSGVAKMCAIFNFLEANGWERNRDKLAKKLRAYRKDMKEKK